MSDYAEWKRRYVCSTEGSVSLPEILIHRAHGMTYFAEDGACKQFYPLSPSPRITGIFGLISLFRFFMAVSVYSSIPNNITLRFIYPEETERCSNASNTNGLSLDRPMATFRFPILRAYIRQLTIFGHCHAHEERLKK